MLTAAVFSLRPHLHSQQVPATPKAEVEEVLSAGLPFAQKELEAHGEFYPFAFAKAMDGKVTAVAVPLAEEHPVSQKMIDALVSALKAGVTRSQYKATGIFVDARVQPPTRLEKTDAIRVGLEHVAGYCVDVFVPYSRSRAGKVTLGESFATQHTAEVVGGCT